MSLPYPDFGIKPVSTHNFGEDKVPKGRIQGQMIAGTVQVISGIINTSINLIFITSVTHACLYHTSFRHLTHASA